MEQKVIRLLRANEIECRVVTISEKGVSLLLYKDARCDMKILDEVYGANNWQRTHELIGGNLYCTVSIWDEGKKQWIGKADVGTKSYAEKGERRGLGFLQEGMLLPWHRKRALYGTVHMGRSLEGEAAEEG